MSEKREFEGLLFEPVPTAFDRPDAVRAVEKLREKLGLKDGEDIPPEIWKNVKAILLAKPNATSNELTRTINDFLDKMMAERSGEKNSVSPSHGGLGHSKPPVHTK